MLCIEVPVSMGEIFDKLSILEIKRDKLHDERRVEVEKEYHALFNKVHHLFSDDILFHYSILKIINLCIWESQDAFRESQDDAHKQRLCIQIIEDNDRRFRVKHKINMLSNSYLKEQKAYPKQKAFVIPHLGLGDQITLNGAIRYIATCFDEVKVVCRSRNLQNLQIMYADDPRITFYTVENDSDISPAFGCSADVFKTVTKDYTVYTTGLHTHDLTTTKSYKYVLPFCFYEDLGLPSSIFWNYFHVADCVNSKALYESIKDHPYYIIHSGSSTGQIFTIEFIEQMLNISRNEVLLLDIGVNVYPETHPWYIIANEFMNRPLMEYKKSLIHAAGIFVTDSSLFCLAMNLPLESQQCFVKARAQNYSKIWEDEIYGYDPKSKKQKFIQI